MDLITGDVWLDMQRLFAKVVSTFNQHVTQWNSIVQGMAAIAELFFIDIRDTTSGHWF
jgi:hypothetical protein